MISIASRDMPEFSISYFQTRVLPSSRKISQQLATRDTTPSCLMPLSKYNFLEAGEESLFDSETETTRLFRRYVAQDRICLELGGKRLEFSLSLLISSTGYYVLGINLPLSLDGPNFTTKNDLFGWLQNALKPGYEKNTLFGRWKWNQSNILEESLKFEGDLCCAMGVFGLFVHEVLSDRKISDLGKLVKKIDKQTGDAVNLKFGSGKTVAVFPKSILKWLYDRGELETNHIATFGYHCDISGVTEDEFEKIYETLNNVKKIKVVDNLHSREFNSLVEDNFEIWRTRGLESLRYVRGKNSSSTNRYIGDKETALYAKFIEYIAYRRGVMAIIERDTQGIISERKVAFGSQLRYWNWLLSSITDDFVLGRNVDVLHTIKASHNGGVDHFDLINFESQTRKNIASFTERLNAKNSSSTTLLSILFGVLASFALIEFLDRHVPLDFVYIAVISISVLIVFLVAILFSSQRLRPPRRLYSAKVAKR